MSMLAALKALTTESVVEVEGVLQRADVRTASQSAIEIAISTLTLISPAAPKLPFEVLIYT